MEPKQRPPARWALSLAATVAVGVGLGAALATSMGAAGYPVGLLAVAVPYTGARLRR